MNQPLEWLIENLTLANHSPRYMQLAALIEQGIRLRKLTGGDFLPAERVLAERLKLSRVTVSNAFKLLEDKGLILRQQGVGTQISRQLDYSLNHVGLTAQLSRQNLKISNNWLQRTSRPADAYVAEKLNIKTGEAVSYLRRLRLLDYNPVSLEAIYIPQHAMPKPQVFDGSLTQYWLDRGMRLEKNHYSIRALSCSVEVANLLNAKAHSALLQISQVSYNQYGEVLEFSESLCRSDVYQFEVDL